MDLTERLVQLIITARRFDTQAVKTCIRNILKDEDPLFRVVISKKPTENTRPLRTVLLHHLGGDTAFWSQLLSNHRQSLIKELYAVLYSIRERHQHQHAVALVPVVERHNTPPGSPESPAPLVVTKQQQQQHQQSDDLQLQTYATLNVRNVHELFARVEVDLVAESYAPAFDRNDLFLTNVADARRLFGIEQRVNAEAMTRMAAGLPAVDPLTFPYTYIVALRFAGADGIPPSSYVTWCLFGDIGTFLDDVLHKRVVCNHLVTALVESTAVSLNERWKHFYSLETIDDSGGTVSDASLPAFLASLSGYVDLHPNATLNVKTPHGRHRLIFESGSLDAYRHNWVYTRTRLAFLKHMDTINAGLKLCTQTSSAFFTRYTQLLDPTSTVPASRAAAEINGMWRLFETHFTTASRGIEDLARQYGKFKQVATERRKYVESAYAAAQVLFITENVRIPATLSALYTDVIEEGELKNTLSAYRDMSTGMKEATSLKGTVGNAWAGARPSIRDPVQLVTYLRALVLLQLFDPAIGVPPSILHEALVSHAFHRAQLEAHPDRCLPDRRDAATQLSQAINAAKDVLVPYIVKTSPDSPFFSS